MSTPPRRNILVEDLDVLERRRRDQRGRRKYSIRDLFRGGGPDGEGRQRGLLSFVRPFRWVLLGALVLSVVLVTAQLAQVYIMKRGFGSIFHTVEPATTLETSLYLTGPLADASVPGAGGPSVPGTTLAIARSVSVAVWQGWGGRNRLLAAVLTFFALAVFEQSCKFAQRLIMRTIALKIVGNIRMAMFDKLMTFSMRFFHANHSGKIISRLTTDLTNLGQLLVDVMVNFTSDSLMLVGSLVYLYLLGGKLMIFGIAIAILAFIPVQQVSRRLRRKEHTNLSRMGSLFMTLSETISAQKIVKAFVAQNHERERFRHANDDFTAGSMKSAGLRARVQPIVDVVGAGGITLFFWITGVQVIEGVWLEEDFFAIMILLGRTVAAMRRLGDTNSKLHSGLSSADRVATLLYAEAEIQDTHDAVPMKGLSRGIAFRNVSFDYDPEHPVLRDVSLEVPCGRTIALVGHTGSGKTTLADLVPRFYDVTAGAVEIDGVDVRALQVDSLRKHIAVVTQDTMLFHDTVTANIAYGRPDATREQIEQAAVAAHAHGFITDMPHGYDTLLGERGITLSGGERQRLAIARALLKDAPILILDEATSALDSASEQLVQKAINTLKAGRTSIVIAHRLSTVRDADLILVLEAGRIIERGTHAELIGRQGTYAGLVTLQ